MPELRIDTIHFELDDLDAHVALKARVLNLVKLNVGVDVHLSKIKLDIKGGEGSWSSRPGSTMSPRSSID